MKTKVYRNLHNGKFSIVQDNVVVGHADYVELQNVTFTVSQAGRARVLKEKSKNVHAFVVGDLVYVHGFTSFKGRAFDVQTRESEEALRSMFTYNPYKYSSFVDKHSSEPVFKSKRAILTRSSNFYL